MIQQIPWVQRSFHFDFPVTMFPVIFSRLEGSIFRLYSLLSNSDEEICSQRNGGWSVKEHLGHLYDLEELWWKRLQDFQQQKPMLSAADMGNAKTENARHNEQTLEQLLEQFSLERQKMLESIFFYNEDMLHIQMPNACVGKVIGEVEGK